MAPPVTRKLLKMISAATRVREKNELAREFIHGATNDFQASASLEGVELINHLGIIRRVLARVPNGRDIPGDRGRPHQHLSQHPKMRIRGIVISDCKHLNHHPEPGGGLALHDGLSDRDDP